MLILYLLGYFWFVLCSEVCPLLKSPPSEVPLYYRRGLTHIKKCHLMCHVLMRCGREEIRVNLPCHTENLVQMGQVGEIP